MKENRIISFIIVTLVYILATIIGIFLYNMIDLEILLKVFIVDVVATTVVFIFSLIFKNSSVYDPYWSVQPIVILFLLMIGHEFTLERGLMLISVALWGIRLTVNWGYTFKNLYHQDWRYTMLKEKTGLFYPVINYLGIHMFPTIVVFLCIAPAIEMICCETKFSPFVIVGFIVSIGAFVLQGVSDIQMHKFRSKKTGGFIRDGLWKYSRHPNYLGEILMWWGIAIMSFSSLEGINLPISLMLFIGAIVNTLMFLFVSIPMAEKHQASRKPGFEEYKKETRMLLPIKK